jgi:apolipoprotein N-acyltransferase
MTWIRIALEWVLAFALMVLLARLTAAKRRARWAFASVMVVLLGALVWTGGCAGGGGGGVHHDPGTPAGSYTLTVTGTSNGVSRTLKLTLKVN